MQLAEAERRIRGVTSIGLGRVFERPRPEHRGYRSSRARHQHVSRCSSVWTLTVVRRVLCSQSWAELACDLGARASEVAAGCISGGPCDGQKHGEIEPVKQPLHLGIVAGTVDEGVEELQTSRTHRVPTGWRFQGRCEFSERPHRHGLFPKPDGLKQNGPVLLRLSG